MKTGWLASGSVSRTSLLPIRSLIAAPIERSATLLIVIGAERKVTTRATSSPPERSSTGDTASVRAFKRKSPFCHQDEIKLATATEAMIHAGAKIFVLSQSQGAN